MELMYQEQRELILAASIGHTNLANEQKGNKSKTSEGVKYPRCVIQKNTQRVLELVFKMSCQVYFKNFCMNLILYTGLEDCLE